MKLDVAIFETELCVDLTYCGQSRNLLKMTLPVNTTLTQWHAFDMSSDKLIAFLESKEAEPLILSWLFFFTMLLIYCLN